MAGYKGALSARPTVARARIWQSMRIMRRFTMPDLCRTADTNMSNVRTFLRFLCEHGYVKPFGRYARGHAGSYKGWTLAKDTGPKHPVRCDNCDKPLSFPCSKGGDHE